LQKAPSLASAETAIAMIGSLSKITRFQIYQMYHSTNLMNWRFIANDANYTIAL
jgi:hypothetical protein